MAKLHLCREGDRNKPVVILIHGLNGHFLDSWRPDGTPPDACWPHWLSEDSGCDVYLLEYDASLSRWQHQAMPLPDQGDQVASLLSVHPKLVERQLVLIGHSMGGLVIKTLITQSMHKDDPRHQAMVRRIRGVVFIATPHQGAELANLAQAIGKLLRPNPQVGNLQLHDPHLRQLNRSFGAEHTRLGFAVQAFAESRDLEWQTKRSWLPWLTRLARVRVVDPSSSDPSLPGVTAVPLAQNHISISKPANRNEHLHHAVCAFLGEIPSLTAQLAAPAAWVPMAAPVPTQPPARLSGGNDKKLNPVEKEVYGRDAIVAQVLDFLRGDANTLAVSAAKEVSGVGGIGKTEVCKAALKAWLTEAPHAAAWYLSLPDHASLADLLDIAQRGLGLPSQVDTMDKLITSLPPGLYYLDNLESVLSQPEGIKALKAWADQPDVRLLVSSRQSVSAVFGKIIEVDRLPDDAALRLFRETWAGPANQLPQDAELTHFVVNELGGHPLSIVLCARLGDWCSYVELLRRWQHLGTRAADDPQQPTARLGSLDTSLALTAQALHQHNPHTLLLWAACALFHGGVPQDTLEELESTSGWIDARRWLVRHHVLTRNAEGRWAMLPPLARYALDAAQAGRARFDWAVVRQPLQEMFTLKVDQVQSICSSDQKREARRWLQQYFTALARLMGGMLSGQKDEAWLLAIANKLSNEYIFNTVVAAPLLAILCERYPDEALFLLRRGDLESRLRDPDKACACYQEARVLYEKKHDDLGLANTLKSLGDLEKRQSEMDKARDCYEEAKSLYKKKNDDLGLANTLKSLGDLERRLGELSKTRTCYEEALALFKECRDDLGLANTLKSLGDLESRRGEVGKAYEYYSQAQNLYEQESDRLGLADTLRSLGNLEKRLGEVDKARASYTKALKLYEKEHSGAGRAYTLRVLGDLENQLDKKDEAYVCYVEAQTLFKKGYDDLGLAEMQKSFGDLASRQDKRDKARDHYEQARTLYAKEHSDIGLAYTLKSLGDLERRLGEQGKARDYYEQARELFDKTRYCLGLASTLRALGDLKRGEKAWSAALDMYLDALALYQQEQTPAGWAKTLAEIARCQQALAHPEERDDALLKALSMAERSNTPNVVGYVRDVLREITGGEAQAQAWLAAHFDN
ncbi:hypothetical protein BXU06_04630 [Aquaspirillum sp. LM1]|uniref:tetratricopeptide repeat protein n=1 Tax=Aquaspirillum sp. LM1 TaxID=1938604 RepID=UPI0009838E44|nr:tetratricopeptide repeat protein [Aquaspirillum sp. LM1]AQR64423.1 hypothetical protein BXU06_04630 [Aquaspirillum sp. LM1]